MEVPDPREEINKFREKLKKRFKDLDVLTAGDMVEIPLKEGESAEVIEGKVLIGTEKRKREIQIPEGWEATLSKDKKKVELRKKKPK